ncbi:hypothetical protein DRQ50_12795 [bacterium]|nr:MAG: hypothetical protein DRQ50_12795 [bacterium]
MMTKKWTLLGAVLLALVVAGCSPSDPDKTQLNVTQPAGTAALTRYVAVGNSLTAGYMDSGLIMNGQMSSYPLQIALQLGYTVDSSSDEWFAQPLLAWPGVGTTSLDDPTYAAGVLHWTGTSIAVVDSTLRADVPTLMLAQTFPTPYTNLGVPGATTLDVTEALDHTTSQAPGNTYFDIILRNPDFGNVNMIDQVIAQGPTLVSIWIGNNDVLGGATGGNPVLGENVTPPTFYAAMMDGIVSSLLSGVEARFGYLPHIVVGNIPDIASIPFFIPKAVFDGIVGVEYPTDEDDVALVVLPALAMVQGGFTDPLPSDKTLTADEVAVVNGAVEGYNSALAALATEYDFTIADMNAALAGLVPPQNTHFLLLVGNGMPPDDAAAATLFSLDGVHPNNRGYTMAANVFIDAINTELELTGDDALVDVPDDEVWNPEYPPPPTPGSFVALIR